MLKKINNTKLFLLINLFVPGSANIRAGNIRLGSSLVVLSQLIFFSAPYLRLTVLRVLYPLLLLTSYFLLLTKGTAKKDALLSKHVIVVVLLFVMLSILSLNYMYLLVDNNSVKVKNNMVYVLGTKPFKLESMQKMLQMSDDELLKLLNNDIHPFFRRLKAGIEKTNEMQNNLLFVSAGKNQKKITQRILKKMKKEGIFFSCKSTKEEISAINDYIFNNGINDADIIIVSDDYHAFRVLLYSKLNNLSNVKFLATSYKYSISSFVKRYLIEQSLFLFSYISFPVSLTGAVI